MADPLSQKTVQKNKTLRAKPSKDNNWWGWAIAFIVLLAVAWSLVGKKYFDIGLNGFTKKPFIGDLGGVPVEIPHHYIHAFVGYDGDPSYWKGKFHTRPSQSSRTYHSKMKSLIIEARYPDMAGKSTSALYQEWLADRDLPSSKWIDIGISSGEIHRKGIVHDIAEERIDPYPDAFRNYTRMPDKVIGGEVMEVYIVLGNSPHTGLP